MIQKTTEYNNIPKFHGVFYYCFQALLCLRSKYFTKLYFILTFVNSLENYLQRLCFHLLLMFSLLKKKSVCNVKDSNCKLNIYFLKAKITEEKIILKGPSLLGSKIFFF